MKRWSTGLVLLLAVATAACNNVDGLDPRDEMTGLSTTTSTLGATTSVDPGPDFEGLLLESGSCQYGGLINRVFALDRYTVEFALCQPDPGFLAKIAFGAFGVHPEDHLEATAGAPLRNPIGTGPYLLLDWVDEDSIVFERFDDYYGAIAPSKNAVLKWTSETSNKITGLQSGEADGVALDGTDELGVIQADPNLVILNRLEPNVSYLGFTNTIPPFDDVLVRRAISTGIDRARIVNDFYPPGSEVASHFAPCSVENGCSGEPWYGYDLEAAQALLAQTEFGDGFETVIYYAVAERTYLPSPEGIATEIQAQLAENLNISARIEVLTPGQLNEAIANGALDGIYLLGWSGDYPHISNFLDTHFAETSRQFGDPHPEIYEPLREASQLGDPAAAALYEQANNAIRELIPMIPIARSAAAFAAVTDIQGASAPPWGSVMFNHWDNGADTLVFVQSNEPASLYCADETDDESLRACAQVVEPLYSYTPEGEVQPQLAEECVPNEDLSVWTCSLRRGVLFHDGSTLDANDVVASFTAGLDASSPLHTGNSGEFAYYEYLWKGLINASEADE